MNFNFLTVLIVGVALVGSGCAFAASHDLSGYAWSENIGWIQFNPVLGGVSYDDVNGELSGYAWSENIGWIDFGPSGGFPETPEHGVEITLGTGNLTGWAKAVAGGTAGSGGWDGWIKMNEGGASPAKVNFATGLFSGWAWGSDVVGWISFSGTGYGVITDTAVAPTVTFSASPATVEYNNSSTLTWSSTDASSCSASGDWSGVKAVSGSESTGNLTSAKTYSITCTGPGGSDSEALNINVDPDTIPNFSLSNSGALIATIIGGGDVNSNSVVVSVTGVINGFSSDVNLSIDPIPGDPGFTINLGDNILTSSEYGAGASLSIGVPGLTPIGTYPVTIKGVGGGLTRSTTVNLRVEALSPSWIEI